MGNNFTVRGIPVDGWQKCDKVSLTNTNYTIDFYFTSNDWISTYGITNVPVRAEMKGTTFGKNGRMDYHHIYDFINVRPLDLDGDDANIFDVSS